MRRRRPGPEGTFDEASAWADAPEPRLSPPFDDLTPLSRSRLVAMDKAARDLFKALRAFSSEGRHPVRDVLAAVEGPYTTFTRYPADGVGDASDQFAWYYHAHDPTNERPWKENGHFHCFGYSERLPSSASPLALPPDANVQEGGLVHLVAVCMGEDGVPDRLFTLNRWASDEWLYPAADVIPLLDQFRVERDKRFADTSRWLSAMLRLMQPQIAWLLRERDEVLGALQHGNPEGFSEDPSVEVASMLTFNLDDHLQCLDHAMSVSRSRS